MRTIEAGQVMDARKAICLTVTLLLGACANETAPDPKFSLMHLGAPKSEAEIVLQDHVSVVERAQASKVLSAIAFERVTGNPVDPARLVGGQ